MLTNLFYFKQINLIGGTEQFLYEMATKYKSWDITILYKNGNPEQLKRMRSLVRCIKYIPRRKNKMQKSVLEL